MLGAFLFTIVVLAFVAATVIWIVDDIRRPGFLCSNGHWQSSGKNHCKKCGLPVKPYNKPKCSNGHEMGEGQEFCSECGEKIAIREEQSPDPAQVALDKEEPQKKELRQKHKARNRVLAWILVFVCFGGLVWGTTYFLQIIPLKEKLKYSNKWSKIYKGREECEGEKRRILENKAHSRGKAKEIADKKIVWEIISWHVNEKKSEGVVWMKPVTTKGYVPFYDREKEIRLESRGIDNWSRAFRSPGFITLKFDYHGEWEEIGDYLLPTVVKKK